MQFIFVHGTTEYSFETKAPMVYGTIMANLVFFIQSTSFGICDSVCLHVW